MFGLYMVFVYVIKSEKSARLYVGISKNLEVRLSQHNAGKSKFTKGHMPWTLLYSEKLSDYGSARQREKYLKSAAGKRWLRNKLGI